MQRVPSSASSCACDSAERVPSGAHNTSQRSSQQLLTSAYPAARSSAAAQYYSPQRSQPYEQFHALTRSPSAREERISATPADAAVQVVGRNIVTCTSASGGAGTSTLAALVARSIAQKHHDVSLIDADLRPAAGGLDVLLGLEHNEGLRWHEIEAPLGQLNASALHRQLPVWEQVRVLAFHSWQEQHPQWFEVQAVAQALASLDSMVIVDAGDGAMIEQVPAFIEASHVIVAQLSVLGLARARAHMQWLERIGLESIERRTRPPKIGQESRPLAAVPGRIIAVVGIEPIGTTRGRGIVSLDEASEHLGMEVLGPIRADGRLCADLLEGFGLPDKCRKNSKQIQQIASAMTQVCIGGHHD